MRRLFAVFCSVLLVFTVGCSRTPTPEGGPVHRGTGSSASPGVLEAGYLKVAQDYYGNPATLTITAWLQRSRLSPSGESSLAVTVHVGSVPSFKLTVTSPELRVYTVGKGGLVPLEGYDYSSPKRPVDRFGGNLWGSFVVDLPSRPGPVVVRANVGPDATSAKSGVEMRLPVEAIPTTATVRQYNGVGTSGGF